MTEIILSSPLDHARGVIGRYPSPDERYVFEFRTAAPRLVHMVGVRRPLRVTWFLEGVPVAEKTLSPWTGHGSAVADKIVEERP